MVGSFITTVAAGTFLALPGAAFAAPQGSSTPAGTTASPPSSGSSRASEPACTPAVFSQAQQKVEADLAGRVTRLNALQSEVNQSGHLTPSDKQTLLNDIGGFEIPGIQGLQAQVQQATTCAQLWAAAHSMVFDYRVYVVMTPQTELTIGADDETSVEGRFVALEPVIASAIQEAKAHGKDVTAAEAAFDDLKSQVVAAQNVTNGLSAQLLQQQPHGYPANWQVFLAARTSESNARNDLHTAYTDAEQIRADLR